MLLPAEAELRELVDVLPADLDAADLVRARFQQLRETAETRLRRRLLAALALSVLVGLVLLLPRLPPLPPLPAFLGLCILAGLLLRPWVSYLATTLPEARAYPLAQAQLARSWDSLPTAALHLRVALEAGVHRRVAIALGLPDAPGVGVRAVPSALTAADLRPHAGEIACTLMREGFQGSLGELVEAARACVDQ